MFPSSSNSCALKVSDEDQGEEEEEEEEIDGEGEGEEGEGEGEDEPQGEERGTQGRGDGIAYYERGCGQDRDGDGGMRSGMTAHCKDPEVQQIADIGIGLEIGVGVGMVLDVPCVRDVSGTGSGEVGGSAEHGTTSHTPDRLCPSSSSSFSGFVAECGVSGDASLSSTTPQSLCGQDAALTSGVSIPHALQDNDLAIRSPDIATSTGISNEYE